MNERYQKAINLRDAGKTFSEIGEALEVSGGRARQIYYKALRLERTNKLPEKWTHGLKSKTASALIASGYDSKQKVIKGLKSGAIGLVPGSSNGKIFGIGKNSIAELSVWAGVITSELAAINEAIHLLESHGYKVTKS